jgi:protein O-mannosyl-transferase
MNNDFFIVKLLKGKKDILICLFLIISTFSIYARVLNYDFINFDDNVYVTENELVKKGITADAIIWSFTHFHAGYWHPLTWISHMMDCQFFGLNAGRHHLINLIFHLINSLLLYIVFKKMTKKSWQSGFVAALFALHPLHVEAVAWISERKEVLCTFFGMLTILNYLWYVRSKNIFGFLGVILFFAFGLMSKPMLVTLPFVLLLLDYWPLKRFWFQHTSSARHGEFFPKTRLFLEKLPLFFLSLISCVITVLSQKHGDAISSLVHIPFFQRLANAVVSYVNYIYKTIYPINLAILYPYNGMPPYWKIAGSVFLIIIISFFSIRTIRSHPYFIVGWLWFLGTLVPVIGLVQAGTQSMADRFTYIPLTGLFIIIAWGAPEILSGWRHKKLFLFTASFCLIFMFSSMSWQQTTYWENGETISRQAVDVTSGNWIMENNLANMLVRKGAYSESIAHYIEAFRIKPEGDTHYKNLIFALHKISTGKSVAERMASVISLYPEEAALYFLVGKMYRDENKVENAIRYFKKTIEIDDHFVPAYYELSILYMLNNEPESSIAILKKLIELQPDSPIPYSEIARTYQFLGNKEKAAEWYRNAAEKGSNTTEKQTDERGR